MSKLYTSLFSQAAQKQRKLASRLLRSIQNGTFSVMSSRQKWRKIKRLRRLEKRLGLGAVTTLKHWAVAAALGLITFTASAQQAVETPARQPLIERNIKGPQHLKNLFRQRLAGKATVAGKSLARAATEAAFVQGQIVGDPGIQDLAFADLDGDGDTDFVQAGYYSVCQVFINDGQGNFTKGYVLTNDDFAFIGTISAADLDGDGDIDLITSGFDTNAAVYLNDGNATFTKKDFGTSTRGGISAIADFNKDEKLDILFSDHDYNEDVYIYEVFFNTGDATFTNPKTLSLANAEEVVVTDLNNDGAADLIFYEYYLQEGAKIMLNNGSGTFSQGGSVNGNGISRYAQAVDADGDGNQDLIGLTINGLTVFKNDGQGRLSYYSNSTLPMSFAGHFKIGDLDEDGDPDLLLTGYEGAYSGSQGLLLVAKNDGSGKFSTQPEVVTTPAFEYISLLYLADIDTDGDLDITIADYTEATAYLNNGTGGFSSIKSLNIHASASLEVAFADFDGDGDKDAAIAGNSGVWLNEGGKFEFVSSLKEADFSRSVDTADIDADGDLDLLFSTYRNIQGYVYKNNGSAGFSLHEGLPAPGGFQEAHHMRFGDIDNDGDADIIGISSRYALSYFTDEFIDEAAVLQVWLNNGSGAFHLTTTTDFTGAVGNIQLTDINKDGKLDVLACGDHQLYLFTNQADARFAAPEKITAPLAEAYLFRMSFGDIDGDSDQDILISDIQNDALIFFSNNGDGGFTASQLAIDCYFPMGTALNDIDSDGDLDITVVSYYDNTTIWRNQGAGNFSNPITLEVLPRGVYAALVDTDGDDDLDLWWGGLMQTVQVWNNTLNSSGEEPNGLEDAGKAGIYFYPNPSNSTVSIKWNQAQSAAQWQIEILNLSGKLQKKLVTNAAETTLLDLSQLAPGLYLLRLSNGNQSYVQRLVKQ